jgi:hypothetical protein
MVRFAESEATEDEKALDAELHTEKYSTETWNLRQYA